MTLKQTQISLELPIYVKSIFVDKESHLIVRWDQEELSKRPERRQLYETD